jgi:4-diphosphocytidyl-2-C-methyl-D-erythritol kinase
MKSTALKAYAKVNLGLAVIGRREDGFHELRTVYQTISLADDLEVSLAPGPLSVHLETLGLPVPAGRQNLAFRAAEAILEELDLNRSVSLRLNKRIPTGSGLGGASSDAAAVLRAVTYLSGKALPEDRLLSLAAFLGSDVPFLLYGGRALGVGRGEEIYPLSEGPRLSCIVVFPGVSISTAQAYQQLKAPLLTSHWADHNIELFCSKANTDGWRQLGNDFEKVAFAAHPELAAVKKSLLRCGADLASLSGSGSAVFGMFEDLRKAKTAAQQLRKPGHAVFLAHTISRREFQAQLPGE